MKPKTAGLAALTFRIAQLSLGLVLALCAICVPLDANGQLIFAAGLVLTILCVTKLTPSRLTVLMLCLLSAVASTRYIYWRTTETLVFGSPLAFVLGIGLYLAEFYAWVILILGMFQTAWPMQRPAIPLQGQDTALPFVDVYIPTYNESLAIVANTVFAAMSMDYPSDRYRVFLLDDGRRPEFKKFARLAGCGYLTRSDNLHAKAGNLNAAMKQTNGELICVFDCDHVPTRAFLQITVGWFQKDAKLALLQTPHHFYSPDPVQRNVDHGADLPSEGELFYGPVQCGNDLWNAAFFCGSCAVMRREALDQTHGFAGETVTEDAHTALKLQRMGWNTAYINARLSAGLATERLSLHVGQRMRWARGMTQIFRIDNPLFGKGLSLPQRLCYLNAMLHFQFPLPRIVFLTSPLAYLVFGLNIIHAPALIIFLYSMPHLYGSIKSSERLQGRLRRPFWGEIYETLLSFHLVGPTVLTLINPKKGRFNVTDKGGRIDQSYFDLKTLKPHIITLFVLIAGLVIGYAKLLWPDVYGVELTTLGLNTAWTVFSILILCACISIGRESLQTRNDVRIDAKLPVSLYFEDGHVLSTETVNISTGGLLMRSPAGLNLENKKLSDIEIPIGKDRVTLGATLISADDTLIRAQFYSLGLKEQRALIRAVMGRADCWQMSTEDRTPETSGLKSVLEIAGIVASSLLGARQKGRPKPTLKASRPSVAQAIVPFICLGALLSAPALIPSRVSAAPQRSHLEGQTVPLKGQQRDVHSRLTPKRLPDSQTANSQTGQSHTLGQKAIDGSGLGVDPAAMSGPTKATVITLGLSDLTRADHIRLDAHQDEFGIPFGIDRNRIATTAEIYLTINFDGIVRPGAEKIEISVNGVDVGSVPLSPGVRTPQIVRIPVDPTLILSGDNRLNLAIRSNALQTRCTRSTPGAPINTTRVVIDPLRSGIKITTARLKDALDLAQLPLPLFDPKSSRRVDMAFVFAGAPNNEELEAAGIAASWMGSQISYRGFRFQSVTDGHMPSGDAVVFATPGHTPPGLQLDIKGPSLSLLNNPSGEGTLLVIMGRTGDELKSAAKALGLIDGNLSGQTATTDGLGLGPLKPYQAPRWIRAGQTVPLADISNDTGLSASGRTPPPINIDFRVSPDLFFWPNKGPKLSLGYQWPTSATQGRTGSSLDINLNANAVTTLPLEQPSLFQRLMVSDTNVSRAHKTLTLPAYNLFSQNQLSLYFGFRQKEQAHSSLEPACLPDTTEVKLTPDSVIDFGGTHHATQLPNLALFTSAGFPFTRVPDLGDTTVVLSQRPANGAIDTYLTLLGRFGDSTGSVAARVSVIRQSNGTTLPDKDLLVIGPLEMANPEGLFSKSPLYWNGHALVVRRPALWQRILPLFSPKPYNPVAAADSPLMQTTSFTGLTSFQTERPGHTVVAILSADQGRMPALIDVFFDRRHNGSVQGDLGIYEGDHVASFTVNPTYWTGHLPIWLHVAYFLSQYPLMLGLVALGAILLASPPIHAFLSDQERRRLASLVNPSSPKDDFHDNV